MRPPRSAIARRRGMPRSATAGRVESPAAAHIFQIINTHRREDMFKGLGLSMAIIIGGMVGLPAAILAAL
jgi:hypothetical protein